MRVNLIKATNIRKRAKELTGDSKSFEDFIQKTKYADWDSPHDISRTFASADTIGKNRVVFNLKGNNYRLICHYKFLDSWVSLHFCWVGTHEEYDRLCDPSFEPTQYTIWNH